MLHPSTKKLVDRLIEMTQMGKLNWEESDQGGIDYSTEGYRVSLIDTPQEILITNLDGKELERASAADLADTIDKDGRPYTDGVADMYRQASRIARGTETAILRLLAGIETQGQADAAAAAEPVPIVAVPEDETQTLVTAESVTDETTALETVAMPSPEQTSNAILPEPPAHASATDLDNIDLDETVSEAPEDDRSIEAQPAQSDDESHLALSPDSPAVEAPLASDTSSDMPLAEEGENPSGHTDSKSDIQTTAENGPTHDPHDAEVDAPSMTEAVARLADEVNGRITPDISFPEAGSLTAEAGHLAVAVAMAEDPSHTATQAKDTESDPADSQSGPPISEPVGQENEIIISADTSDTVYTPFGATPINTPPATHSTPKQFMDAPSEVDTHNELQSGQSPDPVSEPVSVLASVSTAPNEASGAPVQNTYAAPETGNFNLSEMGTGFGLTPIAPFTEMTGTAATDVPASDEDPQARIIIDAVDEVPPPVRDGPESDAGLMHDLSYPEPEAMQSPAPGSDGPTLADNAAVSVPEASDTSSEDDITHAPDAMLKPRTRFNPWD